MSEFKDIDQISYIKAIAAEAKVAYLQELLEGDVTNIPFQRIFESPESVAGILGYVAPTSGILSDVSLDSNWVQPFVSWTDGSTVEDGKKVKYMKTPFNAVSLASSATALATSQVLVNRMAETDLKMKFKVENRAIGQKLTVNFDGIPQLYTLVGSQFFLFGSILSGQDYLKSLLQHLADRFMDNLFASQMVCVKWDDGSAFENKSFRISREKGVMNLPQGHFIFNTTPGSSKGAVFLGVKSKTNSVRGGKVRISGTQATGYKIEPADAQTMIFIESNGLQYRQPNFSVKAVGGLFFISPFLEPTLERLLDFYIPHLYGGNLGSAEASSQAKKGGVNLKRAQTDGLSERQAGRRINVCPEALFSFSGSPVSVKPGFWGRFEASMTLGGLHYTQVENGIILHPPSGDFNATVIGLWVTSYEEDQFVKILQRPQGPAVKKEGQSEF